MTSFIIAMISGGLIALGAAAIWRDYARVRRGTATLPAAAPQGATPQPAGQQMPLPVAAPVTQRAIAAAPAVTNSPLPPAQPDPGPRFAPPAPSAAVVPTTHPAAPLPSSYAPVPYKAAPLPLSTFQDLTETIGGITHELDDTGPEFPRVAAVEAGWHAIAYKIDAAVARVNGVLAPVHLAIGSAGEPGWSYKNFGFGVYRRIRLHEPSIAWLRIELTGDRKLSLKLRAHRQEQALMNEAVLVPADALTDVAAIDAVALCIKPAAQYAAWIVPRAEADREASAALWAEIDGAANAALHMTNGALQQAGATLVPLAQPAYEPATLHYRWPLSVNVNGATVALMILERQSEAVEISVGVPDPTRYDLGRRRRITVDTLTPHALAEHMASSAWPSIADARQYAGQ